MIACIRFVFATIGNVGMWFNILNIMDEDKCKVLYILLEIIFIALYFGFSFFWNQLQGFIF